MRGYLARSPGRAAGTLTPVDARLVVDAAVQGVVVSNHGGRQLDRLPTYLWTPFRITVSCTGRSDSARNDRPEDHIVSTMLYGVDPRTNETLQPGVPLTAPPELERALAAAHASAVPFAATTPQERIALLTALADALDAAADELVPVAEAETALPEARLRGELARTSAQLRLFAEVVADGAYLDVIIDHADDTATPPHPDLRSCLRPLGPVLVYAASNFPFAFSVLGGDTASALAVGAPVLLKAHPSHPRLSQLTAALASRVVAEVGMPEGVFAAIFGDDIGVTALQDPRVKACGFTGSLHGGRFLFDLATSRPDPIPFYGELGSINPVVVTAAAAAERGQEIAAGFVDSFTLGTGQFCTKPGLIFLPEAHGLEQELIDRVAAHPAGPLLNQRIAEQFASGINDLEAEGIRLLVRGEPAHGPGALATPTLYASTAEDVRERRTLTAEHFGPAAIVVTYRTRTELLRALETIDGSLTASVHTGAGDDPDTLTEIVALMAERAGRIVHNGWPTGVGVTWSMQHGGPWPATTASVTTSVGATSVGRWLRRVCYQAVPDELLPPALRHGNPWGVPRRVDGHLEPRRGQD